MRDQWRNILRALTKRWDVHRENVQPIVQITAESPGAHILRQIPIRRRHESHIDLQSLRPAQPFKFPLLQHAQQQNLHFLGQFADFVQKKRAAMRLLEATFATLNRTAEGSALVPE